MGNRPRHLLPATPPSGERHRGFLVDRFPHPKGEQPLALPHGQESLGDRESRLQRCEESPRVTTYLPPSRQKSARRLTPYPTGLDDCATLPTSLFASLHALSSHRHRIGSPPVAQLGASLLHRYELNRWPVFFPELCILLFDKSHPHPGLSPQGVLLPENTLLPFTPAGHPPKACFMHPAVASLIQSSETAARRGGGLTSRERSGRLKR